MAERANELCATKYVPFIFAIQVLNTWPICVWFIFRKLKKNKHDTISMYTASEMEKSNQNRIELGKFNFESETNACFDSKTTSCTAFFPAILFLNVLFFWSVVMILKWFHCKIFARRSFFSLFSQSLYGHNHFDR